MRAGLLTRFMGILGAIVGALQVVRIGPLPLVQTFWFLSLALLLSGRRQGGDLPAWRTGREEPWPSQREVAESPPGPGRLPPRREVRARAGHRVGPGAPREQQAQAQAPHLRGVRLAFEHRCSNARSDPRVLRG